MKQGTTPKLEFTSSLDLTDYKIRVNIAQRKKLLALNNDRVTKNGAYMFSVELTQEETAAFDSGVIVAIQVDVINADGLVIKSDLLNTTMEKALNNEVMKYE